MRRLLVGFVTASAILLAGSNAHAVGTRTFDLDSLEDFTGGELEGVSVGSDGRVRAGWTLGQVPIAGATSVFASAALDDASVLVGTAPDGKVFKVTRGRATEVGDTQALAVTSIVRGDAGEAFLSTIPDGKVFRYRGGKVELFTTLKKSGYVWSLAYDAAKKQLFAATGPDGTVYRIDRAGKANVFFRSEEPHLVSVAVGPGGRVVTGSSGTGRIYDVRGPGRASVLFEPDGEEVKAVAIDAKGNVFAIANEYGKAPVPPNRAGAGKREGAPGSTPDQKPGKGSLYRIDAAGRPEKMMHHSEFHYTALAIDADSNPLVGTGAEGRVYTVDDAHVVTLVADTKARQVGAIAATGTSPWILTSDPAAAHPVIAKGGTAAVWTSKVLDCSLRARTGHISWRATGALAVSVRTGNTAAPDATWSAWSAPIARPGRVKSPPGRFVQVRARWTGGAGTALSELMIPYVTDNARPVVLEVAAKPKGAKTETKPAKGGKKTEKTEKHDDKHVLHVTWKVENPDEDELRYRVHFRREGQTMWRPAVPESDVLTKAEYDWDTSALPEGRYRLRIQASDEIANPPGKEQRHALESRAVLVDNTPPVIREISIAGRRLRARAVDGLGPIDHAEVAVDGQPLWRPVDAKDGIFDTADEVIEADLGSIVSPGKHLVTLRVFDAAGNSVSRDIETQ